MSFQIFQWSLGSAVLSNGAQSKASAGGLPLRLAPTDETSAYKAKIIIDAPVLYYRFNEAASGPVGDESGSGINASSGTAVDFSVAGALLGDPNDSFRLKKAANGQVVTANNAIFDFGNSEPFSVECWIKPSISIEQHDLISKYDTGTPKGWSIEMPSGQVSIDVSITGTTTATASFDPSPGIDLTDSAWHHVVMVYDASTPGNVSSVHMWIDGIEIAPTGSGSISTDMANAAGLSMGLRDGHTTTVEGYLGPMDEVAIYDKVLPEEDIIEHYNLGAAGGPFFSRVTFRKDFPDSQYPNGVEVGSIQLPGALGNLEGVSDQRKVKLFYDIGAGEVEIKPIGGVSGGIVVPQNGSITVHVDLGVDEAHDTLIQPYLGGQLGASTGPVLFFNDLAPTKTSRVVGKVIS